MKLEKGASLGELKQFANTAGCFIVVKPVSKETQVLLLYRRAEPKNVLVGRRKTEDGMRILLSKYKPLAKPNA